MSIKLQLAFVALACLFAVALAAKPYLGTRTGLAKRVAGPGLGDTAEAAYPAYPSEAPYGGYSETSGYRNKRAVYGQTYAPVAYPSLQSEAPADLYGAYTYAPVAYPALPSEAPGHPYAGYNGAGPDAFPVCAPRGYGRGGYGGAYYPC